MCASAGNSTGSSNGRYESIPVNRQLTVRWIEETSYDVYYSGKLVIDNDTYDFNGWLTFSDFKVRTLVTSVSEPRTVWVPDTNHVDRPLSMSGAEVGRFENEIQLVRDVTQGVVHEFVVAPVMAAVEGRVAEVACRFVKVCSAAYKLSKPALKHFQKRGKAFWDKMRGGEVPGGGDDAVDAYRAVSRAEADDIAEHGFRPDPSGGGFQEGKWFSETREGAEAFRNRYSDLDDVVHTKVPKPVYDRSLRHPNIDNTGPGFCIQCDDLPLLPKPE